MSSERLILCIAYGFFIFNNKSNLFKNTNLNYKRPALCFNNIFKLHSVAANISLFLLKNTAL